MEHGDFNMDGSQSDDFLSELLSRFEQMMKNQKSEFFDSDELIELIDYYIMTSQLHLAKRALDLALSQYSENIEIQVYKAMYLHAAGRSAKAIELLREIIEKQSDNVEALISLGEILSDTGKQSEAVKCLEKALKHVDKEERPIVIQQIIDALDDAGQHYKMIPYLKELISIQPGNPDAMSSLAYCYNILSREEEGATFFLKIIEHDPFNTYAWFNLGNLHYNLTFYEKAIESYGYVLAIEPKFTSAVIKMGASLSALERIDSAIEVYKQVLEYEKKDASIYNYLGHCYSTKKNYKKAIHYFHKAISLDQEMTEAHLGLVYAYAGNSEFEAAYRHITKIITDYEDTAELWFYKAYLEEQLEKYPEAIISFRKGITINPSDIDGWLSLSGMHTEYEDNYYGALDILNEALKEHPGNVEILYRCAAICFEGGLTSEGGEWLHDALSEDSSKYELMFEYNPLLINNQEIIQIINLYI